MNNAGELIDTPGKAEELAARWMREAGFHDARIGPRGRDRGLDVTSTYGLAQVKWGGGNRRGAPAIQNLFGARGRDQDRLLLFFNGPSYAYTNEAVEVANELGVALFNYDSRGQVRWINEPARRIHELRTRVCNGTLAVREDLAYDPDGHPITYVVGSPGIRPDFKQGDIALSPADVSWFDYRATPHAVGIALVQVNRAMGTGYVPHFDENTSRVTITPAANENFVGLISVTAELTPFMDKGDVVVRVNWFTRSKATPATLERVSNDGHEAGARANRLLANYLGDWEASG